MDFSKDKNPIKTWMKLLIAGAFITADLERKNKERDAQYRKKRIEKIKKKLIK